VNCGNSFQGVRFVWSALHLRLHLRDFSRRGRLRSVLFWKDFLSCGPIISPPFVKYGRSNVQAHD